MSNATNEQQTAKNAGDRVKELRLNYEDSNVKRGKLTQEDLAEMISARQTGKRRLSPQHLGRIERNESPLSPKYAVLLSEFFNVRVKWLLHGIGARTDAEAEAEEVEKRLRFARNIGNEKVAVWELVNAIASLRGFHVEEIPRGSGADFDTHIFQLTDNDQNTFVLQDDTFIFRLLHYARLEVNALIEESKRGIENG